MLKIPIRLLFYDPLARERLRDYQSDTNTATRELGITTA
jgi:hypothetical protein